MYQFVSFARSTRNLTDFLYFFIHIFFSHFHNVEKLNWYISIFWYIFIFLFLFANPFYFHVTIHISSKKLKNISNRETGEFVIRLFLQVGKNWSNFLCFSTHLISFPRSAKYCTNTFYPHLIFLVTLYFTNAFYLHEAEKILWWFILHPYSKSY